MLHQQWNAGYLIGVITLSTLIAICVFVMLTGAIYGFATRNSYGSGGILTAIVAFVINLVLVGILALVTFPWAGVYHRYQPISGKVTANVSSRFLSDGQGTTQNFLVLINGQPYRCDDTRCAQLQKGDEVTLMCEKSYQFNATSGWVCNWGKLGLNG